MQIPCIATIPIGGVHHPPHLGARTGHDGDVCACTITLAASGITHEPTWHDGWEVKGNERP